MKKAVIFDLDGTLLDTLVDITEAGNLALTELGYATHPLESFRYFVGNGARNLMKRALPADAGDDVLEKAVDAFRKHYATTWNHASTLYPGVADLLDELSKQGYVLSILSNKPHEFTVEIGKNIFLNWNFALIYGHREGVPLKPDPSSALEICTKLNLNPEEVLFVGDTAVDMETATNAKITPIGVLWGFRPATELKANGASCLISHPLELLEQLERLNSK